MTSKHRCMNIHEDFENEIEDSEEDANQLDSESFNDSFDAGVIADNVGPAIDRSIASWINEGLLLPSDRSHIKAIIQMHQRPENIESLRTPNLTQRCKSQWVQREEIDALVYCKSRSGAH